MSHPRYPEETQDPSGQLSDLKESDLESCLFEIKIGCVVADGTCRGCQAIGYRQRSLGGGLVLITSSSRNLVGDFLWVSLNFYD